MILLRISKRRFHHIAEQEKTGQQKADMEKEKRVHSSILIPYSYYSSRIPDYFPFVPLHWHREWELNVITEGNGVVRLGEKETEAKAGDIVLIQPELLHAITTDDRLFYDTVVFSSDMFGNGEDRSYRKMVHPLCLGRACLQIAEEKNVCYKEIRECADTVICCARENSAEADLLMKGELLRLLWFFYEGDLVSGNREPVQNGEIKAAIDYMSIHYAENITIADLAGQVNLSQSYFMQKFREMAGMGAAEYLNRLRVQKACEEILSGSSISGAAFDCGFRNLSNFNRQFRMMVGCTPREYRGRNVAEET